MLTTGTRLGPYEIAAPLGAGGMGEVYRALDTRLGRIVALKLLKAGQGERFQTEARAIAALNHPHICTLYDVGPDYLVMEYVDGKPVRGPLPAEEVVRLAGQIAAALEEAHAKGIAHRDLKPDNILLTASGVKLLDFGLAKMMPSELLGDETAAIALTQPHMILGTAFYMSPEQAQGQTVDTRSDIFSFGAVLYELLTGERAFPGESKVTVLAAVLHQEPRFGREIPADLGRIVARCLRKNPGERFQNMAEVRQALDRLSAAPAEEGPSIAVLPFANMSADKENEYFGDGLAEEILNELTKLAGLKVIARTSSFAFKGRNEDIRRIGETLGVAHILEGSVRRAGNRIRITAQLIRVTDGAHAWSERYDRELTDIFAVQDEIAQAIGKVLHCKLMGRCATPRHETSIEAYEAYLEGQALMFHVAPAAMARKVVCFERAIELDPDFAPPYAGLAMHHGQQALFLGARPHDQVPKAIPYLDRALELDPDNGLANCIRAMLEAMYRYNWQAGARLADNAIATNPANALAYLARGLWSHRPAGRIAEAMADCQKAIALDPLSLPPRHMEADLWSELGRPDKVRERVRISLEMSPGHLTSCGFGGNALADCGCFDEAIELLEQGLRIAPANGWLLASLASALEQRGDRARADKILNELEELARRHFVLPSCFGRIYASRGDIGKTYEWLERAVEERDPMLFPLLRAPVLKNLHSEQQYRALLRMVNLG